MCWKQKEPSTRWSYLAMTGSMSSRPVARPRTVLETYIDTSGTRHRRTHEVDPIALVWLLPISSRSVAETLETMLRNCGRFSRAIPWSSARHCCAQAPPQGSSRG